MQYNNSVLIRNKLFVFGILLILVSAIIGPVVYTGIKDLNAAQSDLTDKNYSAAVPLFVSAAHKLIWRKDLWEQAGLAAYNNGDLDNSIRLLEMARQKGSLSPEGWNTLGIDYMIQGFQLNAILTWKSALQSYPSFAPIYDQLIEAYHDQQNYPAEQDVLVKRLTLGDDALTHYRLGLLLTLSDTSIAIREFNAASSLDPEFKSVTGTLRTAIKDADIESNRARQFVILGRGLGLVGEWGLATQAFAQAVNVEPSNAEAWAWLGEAHQHLNLDGSKELDKALFLDSKDTVVLALRGLYWKRQGLYEKALVEYQHAAEIEPDNPNWQVSIGESYALKGDLVSALNAYQKATAIAPNDPTYWRMLAMFCSDNVVQVQDIGLPAAQKAAEIAPKDPQVLDALGWSYLNAGYLYNAEQNLLRAIKVEPDLALAHIHLAETYLRKGDRGSAFVELQSARQLDPAGPSGQLALQLLSQYFP